MNGIDKNIKISSYTLKIGIFVFSLLLVCFIFIRVTWGLSMRPLWDAAGISVFLFFFLQINPLKSYINSLPKPFLKAYAVFFFIFSVGHCLAIPRTTFPFIPWDMFSDETRFSDTVNFFRYEATTLSGKKVSLKPEIYYRSLANGRIVTDLDNLISSIIHYDPAKESSHFKRKQDLIDDYTHKQGGIKSFMSSVRLSIFEENLFTLGEKKQHLNEVLKAIAMRYDTWHPDDPLSSIDVLHGTVDISKGPQAKEIFKKRLAFVTAQGGQMKILHQDASEKAYKFLYRWVFGIWFGYILFDPLMSLAQYPKSIYFPAGFLLKFLPQGIYYLPVSFSFLFFLKVSMLLSTAAVFFGYHKKWAGLGACVFLSIFEGIVRSFGHINHPEMLLLLTTFALTIFFFNEDSIDAAEISISKYGIPIVAVLFIICFTYCFAGIHRLLSRGIDIYSTNTIVFWTIEEGKRSRILNWHMEDLMLTNPLINTMMKTGFPFITFFEITTPFCIISRRFRYLWLFVMIPFHIIVWVFMGIFFWANLALYILFFDFEVFLNDK